MNKARPQHLVLGVSILVVSIIAFYMTFQMPDVDAYRFPRMVIILFFSLGVFFIVATLRGKYDSADAPLQWKKVKIPGVSFLLIAVYVAFINFIGFYTATALFLVGFMKYLQTKSWKVILLSTLFILIFIYALFSYQFKIPLPRGIAI